MLVLGLALMPGVERARAQRALGIDVSSYQATIAWSTVRTSGVSFAWAKATEGLTVNDSYFTKNMTNARTAGVLIGAYHFAHPELHYGTSGADQEAAHFWNIASNYINGSGTYMMPMLDMETDLTNQNPAYTVATLSGWVNEWCSNIVSRAASNGVTVQPVIYTGVSYASEWMNSSVTGWPLWMAEYPSNPNPQTGAPSGTSPWSSWQFWQYNGTGVVAGVSGDCDLDVFNGTTNSIAPYVIGGYGPPSFTSQPSSRYADRGGSLTMCATATGATPLKYQWCFNGTNIAGATTNLYTFTNIQTTNAGSYTLIVTNSLGSVTSSVATLTVNPLFATVFMDSFDTNSSANWTVNKSSTDNRVTFAYDYSAMGIPSAPNSSGGTTKGLKLEANVSLGVVAALSLSPVGQSFFGNYRLHFDMWINVNGPLPGGGNGSTEAITAGVGTAGNRVQWNGSGSTADGVWFEVDGEGGVGDTSTTQGDFVAYVGTTGQATNSGVYAAGTGTTVRGNGNPYYANVFPGGQTAPSYQMTTYTQQTGGLAIGTVGFAWHDVVVNKTGGTVEWFIDGLKIATVTGASITSSNVFVGYWDPYASLTDNTNLSFGLVDNLRVEVPAVAPTISVQPQSITNIVGTSGSFNVTASGTTPLNYQWQLNNTNLAGATGTSLAFISVQTTNAGSYTVVVTNVAGALTSTVATLTVWTQPAITTQPQSITNIVGTSGGFNVTASGTAPLSYQWQLNNANLVGATGTSLAFISVQTTNAGSYTVVVTNVAGALTSTVATLTVWTQPAITTQPQSVAVKVTSNATFTVTATGIPSPAYQWRFNGVPLPGAISSGYTRMNAQYADAGSYSVVVTNLAGTLTSSTAVLSILTASAAQFQAPAVQPDGTLQLVLAGDPGATYFVQSSTNLVDWGAWEPFTNLTLSSGTFTFNIGWVTNDVPRFFRARSGP